MVKLEGRLSNSQLFVGLSGYGYGNEYRERFRRGAVKTRTQFQRPDGQWRKRDERTGQLMQVKNDGQPFWGGAKEPDKRDTDNA